MPPFENKSSHNEENDNFGLFGSFEGRNGEPHAVPLVGVKVDAEAHDFIAEVKLTQSYHNTENRPIEAVYHFPTDEAAAVCGFQAKYEDGSIVKGIVKKKEDAKQDYDQAKVEGKQANLLQSVRRDIFSLNVGNLPAGGYVQITITYVTTLQARDDAMAFILPTHIAPRYSPSALSASEAQAMAPPGSVKMFGLDISATFVCRSAVKKITCPTHVAGLSFDCKIKNKTGRATMKDITMDRDLVILVQEEESHQPRVSLEVSANGKMTGFVTLFPQIELPDKKREFIFVIDRSGSMGGTKIMQAREALSLFLRALPPACTFNIVGFGSRYESLFEVAQIYSDSTLEQATAYVNMMQANLGGTEILSPLRYVFGERSWVGVERQVFVLTDGQVSNDKQVFDLIHENCSDANSEKFRLFSVGVGQGVSRHLVSGMARAGRGTSRFVEEGLSSILRTKVLGQLKQALQPSLEQVNITWNFPKSSSPATSSAQPPAPAKTLLGYRSPAIDDIGDVLIQSQPKRYPSFVPPIFSNERFLSYAMFPSGSSLPESVTVSCQTPDGPLAVTLDVSETETFQGSIACKLAARAAVSEYEDSRMATLALLESDIVQLALENSLVSERTSFVAIHEGSVVDPGNPCATKVIPQAVPSSQPSFLAATSSMDERLDHTLCCSSLCEKSASLDSLSCQRSIFKKKGSRPSGLLGSVRAAIKSGTPRRLRGDSRTSAAKTSMAGGGHCPPPSPDVGAYGGCYGSVLPQSSAPAPPPPSAAPCDVYDYCEQYDSSLRKPTPRDTPTARMLTLCVLQKADGSFPYGRLLCKAVGLTEKHGEEMIDLTGSPDLFLLATALAIATLRWKFFKQERDWELQGRKAMAFLESHLAKSEVETLVLLVDTELRKRSDLLPSESW